MFSLSLTPVFLFVCFVFSDFLVKNLSTWSKVIWRWCENVWKAPLKWLFFFFREMRTMLLVYVMRPFVITTQFYFSAHQKNGVKSWLMSLPESFIISTVKRRVSWEWNVSDYAWFSFITAAYWVLSSQNCFCASNPLLPVMGKDTCSGWSSSGF